jgi:hypothetical protein
VTIVEGEQSTGTPPVGEDDDAQIRESDVSRCVASFEVGNDGMIIPLQAADGEPAGRQVILRHRRLTHHLNG